MTAEPDTLRLVPDELKQKALDLCLHRIEGFASFSAGKKTDMHKLVTELLAAAPAVQPAAGREEIALYDESAMPDISTRAAANLTILLRQEGLVAEVLNKLLSEIRALAHPPAQGSESGPTCQKCGGEIHGWCCQSCDAEFRENDAGNLVFDEDAALSPQPGPASEGDGE